MKRMLKSTLPAFVLAASVMAIYAGNEVTLKNGNIVDWSKFVTAVQDPGSVTGDLEDFLKNNPNNAATLSYNSAVAKQTAAETAVTTAQGKYDAAKKAQTDAEAEVTSAQTAVTTAQTDLDNANAAVTAAQAAYIKSYQDLVDAAQQDLTTAQNELTALEKRRSDLESKISGVNTTKQSYSEQITNLNAELTPLVAQTITKEIKTVKPWLKSSIDNEAAFASNYNTYYKGAKTYKSYTVSELAGLELYPTSYIYCKVIYEEDREEYYLELSFTDLPTNQVCVDLFGDNVASYPNQLTNDNWYKLSVALFDYYIVEPSYYSSNTSPKTYAFDSVDVYLGPDYPKEGGSGYYNVIWSYTNKNKDLFNSITSPLDALGSKEEYVTITYEQSNPNQARIDEINQEIGEWKDKIATANTELAGYQKQLNGVHGDAVTETNPETDGVIDEINDKNDEIKELKETTIPELQDDVKDAKQAVESGAADKTEAGKAIKTAKETVSSCETALGTAKSTLAEKQEAAATMATELETATTDLNDAKADKRTADTNVATAQVNAQAAANTYAFEPYNTITLNSDIDATSTGKDYSGTIYGKGHTITVSNGALFANFSGTLSETAVNGSFATVYNRGTFTDVAVWTGSNGRYYDHTAEAKPFTQLDELAYAARSYFGANFTKKKLASLTPETTVYYLTVYEPTKKTNHYVTIAKAGENNFIDSRSGEYTIPVNMFAESADGEEGEGVLDIPNVFYNGYCRNAKVVDRESFFAPKDIEAGNVEYAREFNSGMNAVCLPFDMDYSYCPANTTLSTYEEEDETTFWFKKQADNKPIPANTPLLVKASSKFTLTGLDKGVVLKATPEDQIVEGKGSVDDSRSFGTFANTNCADIATEKYSGNKVYGLSQGTFKLAAATAIFPAFRMVIRSENTRQDQANAARRIRIVDEKGIEITDETSGIATPSADATSFSVVGGQGEIKITSEADYGDVAIYSLDGKMIKVANVMAGTTSVNLQQGVYIVLGKKVMVK